MSVVAGCGPAKAPAALEHDAALDFGAVGVGTERWLDLALENTGETPALVTASVDSASFSLGRASFAVDRGGRFTLRVRFGPRALGAATGVLSLRTDDGATRTVSVSGRGTGPQLSAPDVVGFRTVALVAGRPPDVARTTLSVRNTGTPGTVLHVGVPAVDGDEVCVGTIEADACVPWSATELAVGVTEQVPLSLRATSPGPRRWTLTLRSDDVLQPRRTVEVTALVEPADPCVLSVPSPRVELRGGVGSVTVTQAGPGTCVINDITLDATPVGALRMERPAVPLRLAPGTAFTAWISAQPLAPSQTRGVLHVTPAGGPGLDVPLVPAPAQGPCLVAIPEDLDFGTVQAWCNSPTRVVTLYNVCARPLVLESARVAAAAGQPPGGPECPGPQPCPEFLLAGAFTPGTVLASAELATVTMRYRPLDFGPDTGAVQVTSSEGDAVVSLRGQSDSVGTVVDRFRQDGPTLVDWLILVDTSPSFLSKRPGVRSQLAHVLSWLGMQRCIDARVAFASADGAADAGVSLMRADGGAAWQSSRVSDFQAQALSAFDALPVGSEVEACIGPAVQVLSAPDAGPRPGAVLSAVCITDALEQTPDAGGALADFKALAPSPWPTWSTVAGLASSTCAVEAPDDGTHAALVAAGYGVREDVCDAHWHYAFESFGSHGCQRSMFFLTSRTSGPPEVRVDGVLLPMNDAQGQPVWRHELTSNAVVFEPGREPAPGATLEVTYTPACLP